MEAGVSVWEEQVERGALKLLWKRGEFSNKQSLSTADL